MVCFSCPQFILFLPFLHFKLSVLQAKNTLFSICVLFFANFHFYMLLIFNSISAFVIPRQNCANPHVDCNNLFIECDILFIECTNPHFDCDNLFIECDNLFIKKYFHMLIVTIKALKIFST